MYKLKLSNTLRSINTFLQDEWCERDMKFKPVTEKKVPDFTIDDDDEVPASSPWCCMMLPLQ